MTSRRFTCSKSSLAGDVPCTSLSLPVFLVQPVLETYLLNLLILGENIPWFHERIVLVPSFSKTFGELSPLPICQCFFSFCLQRIIVAFLAYIGRVWFLTFPYHHGRQPSRNWDLFSLHWSQRNIIFCGTLIARTNSTLALLPDPCSLLFFRNLASLRILPELLFFSDP